MLETVLRTGDHAWPVDCEHFPQSSGLDCEDDGPGRADHHHRQAGVLPRLGPLEKLPDADA